MLSCLSSFCAAQATFIAVIAQSVGRFQYKADKFRELVDPPIRSTAYTKVVMLAQLDASNLSVTVANSRHGNGR